MCADTEQSDAPCFIDYDIISGDEDVHWTQEVDEASIDTGRIFLELSPFADNEAVKTSDSSSDDGMDDSGIPGGGGGEGECSGDLGKRVEDLEDRVDTLEGTLENNYTYLPNGKRARRGGDRAQWMRIKAKYVSTRQKWCKPGAVMGVYPRGLGPIHNRVNIHRILSVVVYSTDPDTIEALPKEGLQHEYAPVVMVRTRFGYSCCE